MFTKITNNYNQRDKQIIRLLGFPTLNNVCGRISIAELFGKSKKRCGVYLLHFDSNVYYIGQALDVVRRFSQHRKLHSDIIGFSFLPTVNQNLDEQERWLIQNAETNGLPLTNRIYVSAILGETDLDLVLPEEEQGNWLTGQKEFNLNDLASRVILPKEQYLRYSQAFSRFLGRTDQRQVIEVIRKYVFHCVPACQRTEYSFWSLTCLPATNKNTWPRLAALNINFMETFVIGHNAENDKTYWGLINVSKTAIQHNYLSIFTFQKKYPFVDIRERLYPRVWTNEGGRLTSLRGATSDRLVVCKYKKAPRRKV